ncbi:hypothetical protein D4764_03G0012140 [Takifugu flavidus]|nr:hypothetical protein D4764_03G0012140 [Takifugu flavidus]
MRKSFVWAGLIRIRNVSTRITHQIIKSSSLTSTPTASRSRPATAPVLVSTVANSRPASSATRSPRSRAISLSPAPEEPNRAGDSLLATIVSVLLFLSPGGKFRNKTQTWRANDFIGCLKKKLKK